jgi:hypothetical protein
MDPVENFVLLLFVVPLNDLYVSIEKEEKHLIIKEEN